MTNIKKITLKLKFKKNLKIKPWCLETQKPLLWAVHVLKNIASTNTVFG
jgi:hypothetical protein